MVRTCSVDRKWFWQCARGLTGGLLTMEVGGAGLAEVEGWLAFCFEAINASTAHCRPALNWADSLRRRGLSIS